MRRPSPPRVALAAALQMRQADPQAGPLNPPRPLGGSPLGLQEASPGRPPRRSLPRKMAPEIYVSLTFLVSKVVGLLDFLSEDPREGPKDGPRGPQNGRQRGPRGGPRTERPSFLPHEAPGRPELPSRSTATRAHAYARTHMTYVTVTYHVESLSITPPNMLL